MSDNTSDNNKSTQMMAEEQAHQEFVLLSDDVKASLIRQEQTNSFSPQSEKRILPEKQEFNESAEVKSKDSAKNSPQDEKVCQKINSSIDPTKTDVLYFIGINSLALNLLSASNIFTSASAKTVLILWINLLTYLALYQRQPILTFFTKMTKKTGQCLKKIKEVAQKKKGRLFIIVGVLTIAALVLTFQHMNGLITRLEKQNCEKSNILRNLQIELNDYKLKTQRTNQMLHELKAHTFLNQQDSAQKVYYLTKQVKQLEQIVSSQQQQISHTSTVKREEKQTSQRYGIKEDRAGNIFITKPESDLKQRTNEKQKHPQQQQRSQEQTQQQKSHQKPQYQRQNAMKDDRLDFIVDSFMKLNNIIPLI